MREVIDCFRNGDYSFIKTAAQAVDDIVVNFDDHLLFSKEEKEDFARECASYLERQGVFKLIPGRFAVWLMGSMGHIGLARKGLSDVNILIISDTPHSRCREALLAIRQAIGTGRIEDGSEGNYILTIGKDDEYHDAVVNASGFVSLIETHRLGNAEKGFASIEIVSLDALGDDNRALHRAQFHVTENIYEMGANGMLLAESDQGYSQEIARSFRETMQGGYGDYLFFLNGYLMRFLEKQVLKVVAAHACAQPASEKPKKINGDAKAAAVFLHPRIAFVGNGVFTLDDHTVSVVRRNGSLAIALQEPLANDVAFYADFWKAVVKEFDGSTIYIDDPDPDEMDIPQFVAIQNQTDALCEYMQQEVQSLHATGWYCNQPEVKIGEPRENRSEKRADFTQMIRISFEEDAGIAYVDSIEESI